MMENDLDIMEDDLDIMEDNLNKKNYPFGQLCTDPVLVFTCLLTRDPPQN
jgi:hypothetical protein